MNNEIAKHLDQIMLWAKAGGEYIATQAPEVVNQFLKYEFYSSILHFSSSLIGLIVSLALVNVVKKWLPKNDYELHPGHIFSVIGLCISIPLSLLNMYLSASYILKLHIAPKLVVLEKLGDILR